MIKISDIKLNPINPRAINDKRFKALCNSIKEFPKMLRLRPIVIDKQVNNIALGGNMRLRALIELGYTEIDDNWVVDCGDLSDEEKKRFIIVDNIGFGEWDMDVLSSHYDIEELKEYGLEEQYIIEDFKDDPKDDVVPEVTESICKLGDIWQLGKHRLMCGDSTKIEDVEKLMDDKKADMAFNDPPYGMKKEKKGVLNDNLNFNKLLEFNRDWITLQFTFLKENGSWYCWGTDEPLMDIYSQIIKPYIAEQKATFRNLITWNKGSGQGQLAEEFRMYPIADEKCLFFMCGVQGFNNNADNYFHGWDSIVDYLKEEKERAGFTIKDCKRLAGHSENSGCHWFDKSQWMMPTRETYDSWRDGAKNDAFKKEYDEIKKEYDEIKKEYYSTRAYFNNTHDNMNNVWHFQRTSTEERESTGGHATPKPIELCSRGIKSSCPEEGIVMDFFLGSGSTLIACEKTNRICYGMELDEHYCDVIIKRWEDYTGNKAVKISIDK